MSTVLFIFFFTVLFHNISIAFWISVAASLAAIPLYLLDSDRSSFTNVFFTPGFVIFALIYILFLGTDWFRVVNILSDGSMHWAPHVLTMWMRNDFYTSPGLSIVNHGDYPPAVQLFELIWAKSAGLYREGLLFAAMHLLSFSMLLPFIEKIRWQDRPRRQTWLIIGLFIITSFLLPAVFNVSNFYNALDVDATLAFIFAYALYMALRESRSFTIAGMFRLSVIITFILLTKQIAAVLAAVIVLVYISGLISSREQVLHIKNIRQKIVDYCTHLRRYWCITLSVLGSILLPLLGSHLWSMQIRGYVSPDPGIAIFHTSLSDLFKIPGVFLDKTGSSSQQIFSHSFISHILTAPAGFMVNIFSSVSFIQCVVLFIGLAILAWILSKNRRDRKIISRAAAIIVLGCFLYFLAIYLVFLFGGMKDVERNDITTPDRYLSTYLFAIIVLALMLAIQKATALRTRLHSPHALLFWLFAIILIAGFFFNNDTLTNFRIRDIAANRHELVAYDLPTIKANLNRIVSISHGDFNNRTKILVTVRSGAEIHYVQYLALPNKTAILPEADLISSATVCKDLRDNTYLITGNSYATDPNWLAIQHCLATETPLSLGKIYSIINYGNKITLKQITD